MNGALRGKAIVVVGGGLLVALLRRRRGADDPWQRATEAHRAAEADRSATSSGPKPGPVSDGANADPVA